MLPDGVGPVRPGMEIDPARLETYLAGQLPGFAGPIALHQFRGGQSNPTYLLTTPTRRYVLRRKPPGVLLASAHAVDREYRVLRALGQDGVVPVPDALVLCMDEAVIGTPFYVMGHVDGRILRDTALTAVPPADRRDHKLALAATLASLHGRDPVALGLADFGRPDGYLLRQIERWSRQYSADTAAPRVPAMEALIEWLPAHLPARLPAATIVHGDYRVDNVVFAPQSPCVIAVLDWELATLGDPFADLAYDLMLYRLPDLAIPGLGGRDPTSLGLPSEREYVAHYCACAECGPIADLEFYLAFAMFRLAGIFHGIAGRVARGTAASERAREYASHLPRLADCAWRQAQSCG